ncbi:uncharacterized protein I303_107205 [Kwoniella dejecticola CBS 10117]|uniref:FCP1 homology domain-containing protein n=1 Tax=Kwoniella dejecticola CBS 10117 TaxID=1296121 RepID=A0A1A5ZZ07_9TREE|nr:uncharacterized protein I303_06606 [Kwoniella dejecticola CBS 10117]OBR83047.1 hypothetical protein I303_06606 [Kwoniella dejecticola CBS 10117]
MASDESKTASSPINTKSAIEQSQSETKTKNVQAESTTNSSVQPKSHTQSPIVLGPPSVTVTPASPASSPTTTQTATVPHANPTDTPSIGEATVTATATATTQEMKEKGSHPTDSETALIAQQQSSNMESNATGGAAAEGSKGTSGSSPLANLTRRLSGKSSSNPNANTTTSKALDTASKEKEKPSTSSPAPAPAPANTTSIPNQASSSTAKSPAPAAASTSTQKASQKKKKKRKGLAGFLLTLGCLSADEFEEDPKKVNRSQPQTTQKPGLSVTTSQATAAPSANQTKDRKVDETAVASSGHQAEPTATTGTTLVDTNGEGDKAVKANEELVVAPTEPHTLPDDETAGVTSSAVQPPGGGSSLLGTPTRSHPTRRDSDVVPPSTSADQDRTETSGGYTDISNSEIQDESSGGAAEEGVDEYGMEDDYEDEEDRLIEQGGMGIPLDENGQPAPLLPPILKEHHGRKCLVLDLDETLLHSSFKSLPSADYIVPVEIESQIHNVYVIKRPGVDHFLKEMGKIYEIVVFTASLSKYADPVLDMLDIHRVVTHRLFRESCYNHKGNYVKDLSQLGRSIETSIIIDNSPASYIFHPNNAVPVSTWFNDPHDTELTDLCPFLADLATVDDIRGGLDGRMN